MHVKMKCCGMQNTAKYRARLLGSQVVPPVNTQASGTVDFTFTEHVQTTGGEEDRHEVRCDEERSDTMSPGLSHAL